MRRLQYYEIIDAVEIEHESMVTKTLMENPLMSRKIASLSTLTTMVKKEIERAMEVKNVRMA